MTLRFQASLKALDPLARLHAYLYSAAPRVAPGIVDVSPSHDRLLFRLAGGGVYAEVALYLGTYQGRGPLTFPLRPVLSTLDAMPTAPASVARLHADQSMEDLALDAGTFERRIHLRPAAPDLRAPEPHGMPQTLAAFRSAPLRQALQTLAPLAAASDNTDLHRRIAITTASDGHCELLASSPTSILRLAVTPASAPTALDVALPVSLAEAWGTIPADFLSDTTYLSTYHPAGGGPVATLHADHVRLSAHTQPAPLLDYPLFAAGEPGEEITAAPHCAVKTSDGAAMLRPFDGACLTLTWSPEVLEMTQNQDDGVHTTARLAYVRAPRTGSPLRLRLPGAALRRLVASLPDVETLSLRYLARRKTLALADLEAPCRFIAAISATSHPVSQDTPS